MDSELITHLSAGAIPIIGGLVLTLIGFGFMGGKAGGDDRMSVLVQKYGRFAKFAGPFLIVAGIALISASYSRAD